MKSRTFFVMVTVFLVAAISWAQGRPQAADQVSGTASATAPMSSTNDGSGAKVALLDRSFTQRNSRYRLEPGDAFDVVFELSPEFNQHATVQPDGYVSLRGIDDVHVADQTVPELIATLKTAYNKILSSPLISVVLTDFQRPYFIANGQVKNPGKYDLRGDVTVTEGIAIAGGFLDTAKHSQVLLFRRVDNEMSQASVINVKKMLNNKNLHEDFHLRPGDMLFVPKNRVSKIMPYLPNRNVSAYAASF